VAVNEDTADVAPSVAAGPAATGFGHYLFAHAAWFLAFGVQAVLFPYLVRVVLNESAIRFGLAQMSIQLPTTLLILVGGFVADRTDARRTMVIACGLTVLTFLVLGGLVTVGKLTYGLLIVYAIVVGAIGAFATPARDSLLSHIAPQEGGIHKAVALASMAQFGGQIAGMALAALAPLLGVGPLLLGQAGLMGAAAVAATRMKPRANDHRSHRGEGGLFSFMAGQIGGGFSAAIASPVIAPVLVCSVGMGVCFFGAFAVLLPLIVQSHFPTNLVGAARTQIASALGIFSLCFWIGTVLSTMVLLRMTGLRRKGVVYLAALAIGALVLLLCALPVPLWLLCAINLLWGLGGGVAMTLGRGLVQEYAPPDKRARVLSIFTLGLMGGGPIGAVAYGFLAHAIGARLSILVPSLGMLAIVTVVAATSKLRQLGAATA
jgi:MFS family permease